MTASVSFTADADAQVDAAAAWWAASREGAPQLFARELERAVETLALAPNIGRRYRHADIIGLRRLVLPKTRYHVYYVHDDETGTVVVLAIWSALRGRAPPLTSPG